MQPQRATLQTQNSFRGYSAFLLRLFVGMHRNLAFFSLNNVAPNPLGSGLQNNGTDL